MTNYLVVLISGNKVIVEADSFSTHGVGGGTVEIVASFWDGTATLIAAFPLSRIEYIAKEESVREFVEPEEAAYDDE